MKFSIRLKLIAFTFCVVLMVGGGISLYSVQLERQQVFATFEKDARQVTSVLSGNLINSLYFLDLRSLRDQLGSARLNPDIRYTYVTDSAGVVLTDGSTENALRGQKLTDSFSQKMLLSNSWISRVEEGFLKIGGPVFMPDGSRIGHLHVGFSLDSAYQVIRDVARASLYVTAICLGIGMVLAFIIATSFTRPILSIVHASREIGKGKLDTHLKINRGDELGILSESINHMTDDLKRNLEQLHALREIDHAVSSTLDLQSTLDLLLQKMDPFFPDSLLIIRLVNEANNALELAAWRNINKDELREAVGLSAWGLAGVVFKSRQLLAITDLQRDPRSLNPESFLKYGVQSYLGVPLVAQDQALGTLSILTRNKQEFSPEEIEFVSMVAGHAAVAIHNAQLHTELVKLASDLAKSNQELKERAEELGALNTVTIEAGRTLGVREILEIALDKALALTNRERGYIRLKDPVTGELTLAAHHGISEGYVETLLHRRTPGGKTDQVFESGQPLVINDPEETLLKKETLQEGTRSLAFIPIKAHGKAIGILNVAGNEPGSFTAREVHLLEAIGSVIGNAWENARLFQETEVRAKEIGALYDVSTTVNQSLDLDPVLQEVLRKIMDIFHFDAARVYLFRPEAGELHLRSALDTRSESLARTRAFRPGQGNIGKAFQSGEPVIFSDVRESVKYKTDSLSHVMQSSGFNFFAAFPIRTRLKPVGVLSCIGTVPRHLTPAEIRLLNLMTDQIGIAVDHARLYEETKKQAGELEKTNAELRRSNKVKDEFLGIMSHELRTPLSAVMGYAAMLQDGVLGEVHLEQAEALRVIENQTRDLLNMINTILEATKIEAGAAVIQSQQTDLKLFLDEIRSTYDISLKKDVSLIWDYDGDLPPIITDPAKLKHILQNLINNAIKFTHEGQVALSARYVPQLHQVELRVSDTGVGIPPEMQSVIFERFRQVDSSDTRLYGGVGLGLYIAKSFTEMLGGALAVASEAGKGSVFTLALPVELRPAGEYFSGAAHA